MRNIFMAWALAATVGGCAETSTIPLAQDTVQITARAERFCGAAGAEKLALKQAAVETIRRGYDRFIVINAQASESYAGVMASGQPRIALNQGLVIKMFKDGNPQGANALPARDTLGPDWQEQIKKDSIDCL